MSVEEKPFGITITAQMRHGELWACAKRLGSQAALARELGIEATRISNWINLKKAPDKEWLQQSGIESKLFALTLRTSEELWPDNLRAALKNPDFIRRVEADRKIGLSQLAHRQDVRNLLPSPEVVAEKKELFEKLEDEIGRLQPRLSRGIRLRYGLYPYDREHTFEECGQKLGVTQERARQLILRGIRKLQESIDRDRTWNSSEVMEILGDLE